jgi:hypothetical protein
VPDSAAGVQRLRVAGGPRVDITVDDIAMFIRMTDATDTHEQRVKPTDILLAKLSLAANPNPDRTPRAAGTGRQTAKRPRRSAQSPGLALGTVRGPA